jgi:hypothetical protein
MTKEELETVVQTHEHINQVRALMQMAVTELLYRAEDHDKSKFSPAELAAYTLVTPKLRASTYGSDEYKGFLKKLGPALQHHYQCNSHHPEHYKDGIAGMNLFDLLEMFIDWVAASRRHADENVYRSININKDRFSMSDDLVSIFKNTVEFFEVDR